MSRRHDKSAAVAAREEPHQAGAVELLAQRGAENLAGRYQAADPRTRQEGN